MKVIKPQKLSLLTKTFEHRREFYFCPTMIVFFSLEEQPSVLGEIDLWTFVAESLGPALGQQAVLDECMPKSRSEMLVLGSAFCPGKRPRETCPVRVRVGPPDRPVLDKTLYIVGDRFWQGEVPTRPTPFHEMEIRWDRAYGGEGFEPNPLGKGYFDPDAPPPPNLPIPLPNIEAPGRMIRSRQQQPEPAGFLPYDLMWPQRQQLAGTFDERWLKEQYPGFPEDMDWGFYNVAPRDQQSETPLRGDEPIYIENMHPEKPQLSARLPALVPRCYIHREARTTEGPKMRFEEVALRPTTIWLFPDHERGVLIYHGSTKVAEDDGHDVKQVLAAAEWMGRPKGRDHYRTVLRQRLDPEKGHLYVLRDQDLLPDGLPTGGDAEKEAEALAELMKTEQLLKKNMEARREAELEKGREKILAAGMDPADFDIFQPPPTPEAPESPENLPAFAEELEAEAQRQREAQEERAKQKEAELIALAEQQGIEIRPGVAQEKPVGPPTFTAAGELERLRGLVTESEAAGVPLEEMRRQLESEEYQRQLHEHEEKIRLTYLRSAHLQGAVPAQQAEARAAQRAQIVEALRRGESLARRDLTGADLSELDLRRADLSGCFMESVDLRRANLGGAIFDRAVLARADLSAARLEGARFVEANLGEANLMGVSAGSGADFSGANFTKAKLGLADLSNSLFAQCDFSEASFDQTNLSGAKVVGGIFLKNRLPRLMARGADLTKATFLEIADLSGADFSGATLEGASFLKSSGSRVSFREAKMNNARFVEGCTFGAADFRGASLLESNLRATRLAQSDFSGAKLGRSDLSEADLRGARLDDISARDAMFIRANLSGASMINADLMNAILQKANIRGTNLMNANLFGADFARVESDEATNVRGSNQKKVRVDPKWTPPTVEPPEPRS